MYWISPISSDEELTAEEKIRLLVGEDRIFAFGDRTYARRHVKPDDWICFYASGKGIVAHARIVTSAERKTRGGLLDQTRFPWIISLDEVHIYLDKPIRLDPTTRMKLDALRGRRYWQWLVTTTRRVTRNDFQTLTKSAEQSA